MHLGISKDQNKTNQPSWWFQPIWKILVKLDHFPRDRGENKKYLKPPPSNMSHVPSKNPVGLEEHDEHSFWNGHLFNRGHLGSNIWGNYSRYHIFHQLAPLSCHLLRQLPWWEVPSCHSPWLLEKMLPSCHWPIFIIKIYQLWVKWLFHLICTYSYCKL